MVARCSYLHQPVISWDEQDIVKPKSTTLSYAHLIKDIAAFTESPTAAHECFIHVSSQAPYRIMTSKQVLHLGFPPYLQTQTNMCLPTSISLGK